MLVCQGLAPAAHRGETKKKAISKGKKESKEEEADSDFDVE